MLTRTFSVDHEGHTIAVTNSPTTCKLEIYNVIVDVWFGMFMINSVTLTGKLPGAAEFIKVKAVVGTKLFKLQCAIFVDEKLAYSSTGI